MGSLRNAARRESANRTWGLKPHAKATKRAKAG